MPPLIKKSSLNCSGQDTYDKQLQLNRMNPTLCVCVSICNIYLDNTYTFAHKSLRTYIIIYH